MSVSFHGIKCRSLARVLGLRRNLLAFIALFVLHVTVSAQEVDVLLHTFDVAPSVHAANRFFETLDKMEFTDEPIRFAPGTSLDSLRQQVWYWAAEWFFFKQDYKKAEHYGLQALEYFQENTLEKSDCLNTLGNIYMRLSHFDKAARYAKQGLDIELRVGDDDIISSTMNTLAAIYMAAGQLDEAENYIVQGLERAERADNLPRKAVLLGSASEIFHARGKDSLALGYAQQAYDLESRLGRQGKMAIRMAQKATALIGLKQYNKAEHELRAAIPVFRQTGNKQSLGIALNKLGTVMSRQGRLAESVPYFREAADIFSAMGDLYNELHAHQGLYESLWTLNPDSAKIELTLFSTLKDSLYSQATADALARYNAEFGNELLQQENVKVRSAQRRDQSLFGALFALSLVSAAAFMCYNHRKQQKHAEGLVREIERLRMQVALPVAEEQEEADNTEQPVLESAEPNEEQQFLMRVIDVVQASLAEGTYSVEAIASKLNMSVQTFRRHLQQSTGEKPKAYISAVQMQKAHDLLVSQPEMSITEVARQCGFEEVSSFTHAFKRAFQLSPTAYRELRTTI